MLLLKARTELRYEFGQFCLNREQRGLSLAGRELTELCDESELLAFPGTCRLHRAEVLHANGALGEAEQEAENACRELEGGAPWAHGEAYRVLGDLQLARGALDDAEAAFRRAHELGWDPQPGLALLQHARGNTRAGLTSLRRSLAENNWTTLQRRALLLAKRVELAIAAGEIEEARETLDELDANPELWQTPALDATVSEARSELFLHQGDVTKAVSSAQRMVRLYREANAPLNVVRGHLRLAEALVKQGDGDGAELELNAAASGLEGHDLPPLISELERVRGLLRRLRMRP